LRQRSSQPQLPQSSQLLPSLRSDSESSSSAVVVVMWVISYGIMVRIHPLVDLSIRLCGYSPRILRLTDGVVVPLLWYYITEDLIPTPTKPHVRHLCKTIKNGIDPHYCAVSPDGTQLADMDDFACLFDVVHY
jgi:hypothetical protein